MMLAELTDFQTKHAPPSCPQCPLKSFSLYVKSHPLLGTCICMSPICFVKTAPCFHIPYFVLKQIVP